MPGSSFFLLEPTTMNILRKFRWAFFVFVAPSFLIYTYLVIFPIVSSMAYSLTKWNAISPAVFVGLNNYEALFKSKDFAIVMTNTWIGLGLALVIQVGFGLLISFLLYQTKAGYRAFRAMAFLPVVLAPAAVALMFVLIFNSDIGPVNKILESIGLSGLKRNWLSDKDIVFYTVLSPMIYQFIGLYVIVLLAGMQSIPPEILESSAIDGAGSFRTFTMIIVPMIWDIIFICVTLITAGSFKAFEHSYLMTWGGPGVRSAFLGVYMYLRTFIDASFGLGCAIGMVILFISLAVTMIFRAVVRRLDYQS
jgi:raffinose/stachyose/melibiose transport system permease protein